MTETTDFTGLILPTEQELTSVYSTMRCRAISADDFPDWESRLRDEKCNPIPHMRAQRQQRNDCQGQSLANGEEKRHWYCTGVMEQLSDIFAYNGSEYYGRPSNVGRDSGTSIQSGVGLLSNGIQTLGVDPGLPSEADWAYNTYERSANKFAARAKNVTIDNAWVSEHGEMPDFQGMLIGVAAGGSGHIGTYWAPKWSSIGSRRLMDQAPTGGGGHATEIIWAVHLNGKWYLVVWNSHGDQYYLMSQRCYESLLRRNFSPFGAFLLMPDKPEERYVDFLKDSPHYA